MFYKDDEQPPRAIVLQDALNATMKSRHQVYGDPFTDMDFAAKLSALYKDMAGGKYCPAHDEAMDRVFMKIARIACGKPGQGDTYTDAAAYMAIAYECQHVADVCAAQNMAAAASMPTDINREQMDFWVNKGDKVDRSIRYEANKRRREVDEGEPEPTDKPFGLSALLHNDSQTETFGPLTPDEKPVVIEPNGEAVAIRKGLRFRLAKDNGHHEPEDVWEIVTVFDNGDFKARNLSDPSAPQHMKPRAIGEVIKSNHRCYHCPNEVYAPNSVCPDCKADDQHARGVDVQHQHALHISVGSRVRVKGHTGDYFVTELRHKGESGRMLGKTEYGRELVFMFTDIEEVMPSDVGEAVS